MSGKVYLVGAGPGDPGLITVRGLECLRQAEVLVYDRLAPAELLREAPPSARRVYVGKGPRQHALPQEEISDLLVREGRAGRVVVRLKGGDPFVFGRGGEEAEALAAAGVPFEIVPGVTSAVAVPAYAGIPVTHRDRASSFAVATGHEAPGREESRIDWARLARAADTLVLLMGVERIGQVTAALMAHGRPADTPIALVRWGTTPRQETVVATLGTIEEELRHREFGPPAVAIVGEVVRLRQRLRWFDTRPLFGRRVLVTRARKQASDLAERLRGLGAEVLELPTIAIAPPADYSPLDAALARLPGGYDWVVLTSANGVAALCDRLWALGRDLRALYGARLAAIGPATAAALERRGLRVDLVPGEFVAEAVAAALAPLVGPGTRLLLPRAAEARPALASLLREHGAEVAEVAAYRTTIAPPDPEVLARLRAGEVDTATFTSSSTVRNLHAVLEGDWGKLREAQIVCIGPITAATARELGLRVDVVAAEYTIPGLVAALLARLGAEATPAAGQRSET